MLVGKGERSSYCNRPKNLWAKLFGSSMYLDLSDEVVLNRNKSRVSFPSSWHRTTLLQPPLHYAVLPENVDALLPIAHSKESHHEDRADKSPEQVSVLFSAPCKGCHPCSLVFSVVTHPALAALSHIPALFFTST